jgi:phosphatidate cytidylyltransferase
MFKLRLISVIVLIPLVCWFVLSASVATFSIATAVLSLIAAWEWANLMGLKQLYSKLVYMVLMLGGLSFVQFVPFIYVVWFGVVWWLVAVIILWVFVRKQTTEQKLFLNGIIGFLCIIPCWAGLNLLASQNDLGPHYVLLFLFLLWAIDTGAYLAGKRFGKNKLAPALSPGKTIEGVMGGIALMLIVLMVAMWLLHMPAKQWLGYAFVSVVMSFFAVVGDLFESMFKRIAKVKDSGNLIPGHGGMLDRLDSMLAAAPVFTLGMILLHNL